MRLVIRKVQFAPEKPGPQPSAETTRHFLMSDRSLHLEASLDKEVGWRCTCCSAGPGGGLEPQGRMMFSKEATLAEGGLGYRLGGGPTLCVCGRGEEGGMLITGPVKTPN